MHPSPARFSNSVDAEGALGETGTQQDPPAPPFIRKLKLRMPTAPLEGTGGGEAGPTAPEEQEEQTGGRNETQTVAKSEVYIDIKSKLSKNDIIGIDFYFPRNKNSDNRLH